MQGFRRLQVWKKSHQLTLDTYHSTAAFPRQEVFGLTSQMRRAAVSVGGNIAEGCARSGDREFAHFLHIALGSASELEYYLLLAHDLAFLVDRDYGRLADEVSQVKRMLAGLVHKLRAES